MSVQVLKIVADVRESRYVVQSLRKIGVEVVEKTISPGDYVVGEGFAVERKTFQDFIGSIFKKRFLSRWSASTKRTHDAA